MLSKLDQIIGQTSTEAKWIIGALAIGIIIWLLLANTSKNTEIATLQTQLETQTKATLVGEVPSTQLTTAQQQLAAITQQRDELRQKVETINTQLQQTIAERSDDQDKLTEQQKRLTEVDNSTDQREQFQRTLSAMTQERDQLHERIATLTTSNDEARRQLEQYTAISKGEQGKGEQQDSAQQEQLTQLTGQLDSTKVQLQQITGERDRLQQSLATATQEYKNTLSQLTALEADKATIVSRLEKTKTALEITEQKLAQQQNRAASLVQTVAERDQVLQDLKAERQQRGPLVPAPAAIAKLNEAFLQSKYGFTEPVAMNGANVASDTRDAVEVVLQQIHFSINSAQLAPGAQRKAKLAAEIFKQDQLTKLKIVGFSDTVGDKDYNLSLSQQRANAVAQLLMQHGVPTDRIQIIGKGENDLPEQTADGIDEPLNRCVGIRAVK